MSMAARAASPRNRESFAWIWSRLAMYQLQAGALDAAADSAQRALGVFPHSDQALYARARILLAQNDSTAAVATLRRASNRQPHPDRLWLLAEALESVGRKDEAATARDRLRRLGPGEDPRALAVYLASHDQDLAVAEGLIREELKEREDIYTHAALAWVQSSQGDHRRALLNARRALAEGTVDPWLFYHAGSIAMRAGEVNQAQRWLERAQESSQMLFPSQRSALEARLASLRPRRERNPGTPTKEEPHETI